jgi:EamA domain-containing membrane protein RarD
VSVGGCCYSRHPDAVLASPSDVLPVTLLLLLLLLLLFRMWARDDGSLVASPSEDAVEQAAEAVMCTTCHSLVSHVWGQLVWSINHAEAVSEATIKELVEDACDTQVGGGG